MSISISLTVSTTITVTNDIDCNYIDDDDFISITNMIYVVKKRC